MVPPETELFCGGRVGALQDGWSGGAAPRLSRTRINSGGILVDITGSCSTFALSSPLRASSLGEPGIRRRLCGSDFGGASSGPEGPGFRPFDPDRALSAFHENMEFRFHQRKTAGAGSSTQPVERHLAQIPPKPRQAFLLVALE